MRAAEALLHGQGHVKDDGTLERIKRTSPDGDTFAVLHHLIHVLHFVTLLCEQVLSPATGVGVGGPLQPLGLCWRLMFAPLLLHLKHQTRLVR